MDVWNNNVDASSSFNDDLEFQLNKTLHEPYTAFFWQKLVVFNNKKFECKVNKPVQVKT